MARRTLTAALCRRRDAPRRLVDGGGDGDDAVNDQRRGSACQKRGA